MRLTRRQALKLLGTLIVCLCPEKIESYGDTNMDDSNFAKIESGGDITIKDWINTKMDYFFSEKKIGNLIIEKENGREIRIPFSEIVKALED